MTDITSVVDLETAGFAVAVAGTSAAFRETSPGRRPYLSNAITLRIHAELTAS